MRIIYSDRYGERYPSNPVEHPRRVIQAAKELAGYEFQEPSPASKADILRVHSPEHLERVAMRGMLPAASFAAGGAIAAAELALDGVPAFALIRPPGHHASSSTSWGMCFLNNMAIAVKRIRERAGRILILDIDLHFGDGTANIFRWSEGVRVVNIGAIDANFDYLSLDAQGYIDQVERVLAQGGYDLLAVSAGFDTYVNDWGGLLDIDDFCEIGGLVRDAAERFCRGRRFAVLEGGYHEDLRLCVEAFVDGMSSSPPGSAGNP